MCRYMMLKGQKALKRETTMKMQGMSAVGIRFGEMTMTPCLTYGGMRIRRFHNPHRSACGGTAILYASKKNCDILEPQQITRRSVATLIDQ